MGTSMNAKVLLGEYMKFMHGTKNKRMHVYVDKATSEKIKEESLNLGVSMSEYVVYAALAFKVRDIPDKLDDTLAKLDQYISDNNIKLKRKKPTKAEQKVEKGERTMAEKTNESTEVRTEQFHLRVTQETYEEIKRKAAEFSMSISDYVVFVITHFDLMEISKKIDEINRKLDAINDTHK